MTDDLNMPIRVKVCGLTNLEDSRFASGALADYLGFIFFEESPRYIDPARAGAIINWISGPETVGVFVNQPLDDVNMIVRQTGIDLVQLHGSESPEYCQLVEKPVIKVFHVEDSTKPDELDRQIRPYLNQVDYLLFDTRAKGLWGGTGEIFDWDILQSLSHDKPFFLSGGLNSSNIGDACRVVRPDVLDVSSGVEQSPGIKDYDKIELFFERMRAIREGRADGS